MVAEQLVGTPNFLHQEHAGFGQVVAVEKFTTRRTRAPDRETPVSPHLGFMSLADQGGQDVAGLQVVVVARAIEVGGHDGQISGAELTVVGPAHLNARDLGHSVGTVRGLQRAAQKIGFTDGLRAFPRVDATRAQEKESLHADLISVVNDVGLDDQVCVDEIRRVGVVGMNAADLGGGQKDVDWPFCLEECAHCGLIHEIKRLQTHAA